MRRIKPGIPSITLPASTDRLGVGNRKEEQSTRAEHGHHAAHDGPRILQVLEDVFGQDQVEGPRLQLSRETDFDIGPVTRGSGRESGGLLEGKFRDIEPEGLVSIFEARQSEAVAAADLQEAPTPDSLQAAVGDACVEADRPPAHESLHTFACVDLVEVVLAERLTGGPRG